MSARARSAALMTPWAYSGPCGLEYTSPLCQIHWRRIVLDEGNSTTQQHTATQRTGTSMQHRSTDSLNSLLIWLFFSLLLLSGHSIKNASSECSQQSNRLLARRRYLMSGTPCGTSLMDLKGEHRTPLHSELIAHLHTDTSHPIVPHSYICFRFPALLSLFLLVRSNSFPRNGRNGG